MNPRHKWTMKRPGILIPVFFLSCFQVPGQVIWQEAGTAALGGTFAARPGIWSTADNQAGLGRINGNSFSFQHSRPFILKELGIYSLCIQLQTEGRGLGTSMTTYGISGLRKSDIWISYGMRLYRKLTAGAGLHFWNWSVPEKAFFQPGFSFALGIQTSVNDRLMIGLQVLHPVGWYSEGRGTSDDRMVLTTGLAYTFFKVATCYLDLQCIPGRPINAKQGIELNLKENTGLMLGLQSRPFSISGGVRVAYAKWIMCIAFEYLPDTGNIPYTALSYAW